MELAAPQNQIKISILYVKHILNHIRAALGTWVKNYSAMFVLTIRLHQPPTRIKYPAPSLCTCKWPTNGEKYFDKTIPQESHKSYKIE